MSQHYSDPRRAGDSFSLPDIEIFQITEHEAEPMLDEEGDVLEPGFYWWSCFPGCMPDSGPIGPFTTSAKALASARED